MEAQLELTFSVLFLHEAHGYIGQCLEFDINAQGKTLPEAKRALERTILSQIILDQEAGRPPFEGLPRAPEFYQVRFQDAEKLAGGFDLPAEVPPAFMLSNIQPDFRVI